MKVDWKELAEELGTVDCYTTSDGFAALFQILGEDFIAEAVNHYVSLHDGWMLAEGVLKLLKPLGMEHCYKIYKHNDDPEVRQRASYFLKYISDRGVLNYLPELLADPDENVQNNFVEILDQLLFGGLINREDVVHLLTLAVEHPNEKVRQFALGELSEELAQGLPDFAEKLGDELWSELFYWKQILKFEHIHCLDLQCLPWYGQINLSFLSAQENFDISRAFDEENFYQWRLGSLPYHGDKIQSLGQWMKTEYESSGKSLQVVNAFRSACKEAICSDQVQNILLEFNLVEDFKITMIDDNSPKPWQNLYT